MQIRELAAKPMPNEWPRQYTNSELNAIVASIAPNKIVSHNIERIQAAAEAFQWASLTDSNITNKGRRQQLKRIADLCERRAPLSDIEAVANNLDGWISQLLGPVDISDYLKLTEAAELALAKIPTRGPDPQRGRRQFIGSLARIFVRITGRRPGRSVFVQEQGTFLRFVKAALDPFKASQGCEADIKIVLARMKKRKDKHSVT